jgi:hypothetical protein
MPYTKTFEYCLYNGNTPVLKSVNPGYLLQKAGCHVHERQRVLRALKKADRVELKNQNIAGLSIVRREKQEFSKLI